MLERSSRASSKRVPFVFISASEAGWSTSLPFAPTVERALPDFLQRYLKSKRAVEHKMLEPASFKIRPIILRPTHFSHMSHTPFPHISEFDSFFRPTDYPTPHSHSLTPRNSHPSPQPTPPLTPNPPPNYPPPTPHLPHP